MPVIINGTTGISGTDGSAGTPAVQGTDTNTGMFFPAADTIAFSEGGVESMRLDSSGNVILAGNLTLGGSFVPGSSFLRNRIINGDMRIDQRNNGAAVTGFFGAFPVDRFQAGVSFDGTFTMQRSTVAPPGFTNSLLFTVTSPDASLGASQYAVILQDIEGLNTADFGWGAAGAQTVVLSFWARASVTGTYGGSIRNGPDTRSYPFTYTISAADTWEYKTITIPGDTSGTWATDNTTGVTVIWSLGTGSTFSGTSGSWANANFISATGATSILGTNGATFHITGVQLEVGSAATPFERRQFTQELDLCMRYFTNWIGVSSGNGFRSIGVGYISGTTTDAVITVPLSVAMRTNPTISFSGTVLILDSTTAGALTSIVEAYLASNHTFWFTARTNANMTTGRNATMYTQNTSTSIFNLSAEL